MAWTSVDDFDNPEVEVGEGVPAADLNRVLGNLLESGTHKVQQRGDLPYASAVNEMTVLPWDDITVDGDVISSGRNSAESAVLRVGDASTLERWNNAVYEGNPRGAGVDDLRLLTRTGVLAAVRPTSFVVDEYYVGYATARRLWESGGNQLSSISVSMDVNTQDTIEYEVLSGPDIRAFTAVPDIVEYGASSLLEWDVDAPFGSVFRLDNGIGDVTGETSFEVSPLVQTTYILTVDNGFGGVATASRVVSVLPSQGAPEISSFRISPTQINSGGQAILTWTTSGDVHSLTVDQGVGDVTGDSSVTVSPTSVTTTTVVYSLLVSSNTGETASASVLLTVIGSDTPVGGPIITVFRADPTNLESGDESVIRWEIDAPTPDETTVTLTEVGGSELEDDAGLSGSRSVFPTVTTNYLLSVDTENDGGVTQTLFVDVSSTIVAASIIFFRATSTRVLEDEEVILEWRVIGTTPTITLNGVAQVTGAISHVVNTSTQGTYNFTLSATNSANSVAAESALTVVVVRPVAPTVNFFTASPSTIIEGGSSVLSWSISNADMVTLDGVSVSSVSSQRVSPSVTRTYTLLATSAGGTVSSTATIIVNPATQPPVINLFTVDDSTVDTDDNITLRWSVGGTNPVTRINGVLRSGIFYTFGAPNTAGVYIYTLTVAVIGYRTISRSLSVTVSVASVSPSISSYTVSDSTPNTGQSITFRWTVAGGPNRIVRINGVVRSGTSWTTVAPGMAGTYFYVLQVSVSGFPDVSRSLSLVVSPLVTAPVITSFTYSLFNAFPDQFSERNREGDVRASWSLTNGGSDIISARLFVFQYAFRGFSQRGYTSYEIDLINTTSSLVAARIQRFFTASNRPQGEFNTFLIDGPSFGSFSGNEFSGLLEVYVGSVHHEGDPAPSLDAIFLEVTNAIGTTTADGILLGSVIPTPSPFIPNTDIRYRNVRISTLVNLRLPVAFQQVGDQRTGQSSNFYTYRSRQLLWGVVGGGSRDVSLVVPGLSEQPYGVRGLSSLGDGFFLLGVRLNRIGYLATEDEQLVALGTVDFRTEALRDITINHEERWEFEVEIVGPRQINASVERIFELVQPGFFSVIPKRIAA